MFSKGIQLYNAMIGLGDTEADDRYWPRVLFVHLPHSLKAPIPQGLKLIFMDLEVIKRFLLQVL